MIKIEEIKNAFNFRRIYWREHSQQRMRQRKIKRNDINTAINNDEIIEYYESDKPFPSCLVFGWSDERPIHLVIGYDKGNDIIHIISLYEPSLEIFQNDFKTRRK